jgi:hypothetical protein
VPTGQHISSKFRKAGPMILCTESIRVLHVLRMSQFFSAGDKGGENSKSWLSCKQHRKYNYILALNNKKNTMTLVFKK